MSNLKPWFDTSTTETEEIEETRNDIFWYGFGQGTLQGLTSVPGYLSHWLHEYWKCLLQRIKLHDNYEMPSGSDREDEVLEPKKGDSYTKVLYDEIFILYEVGEAAKENYLEIRCSVVCQSY